MVGWEHAQRPQSASWLRWLTSLNPNKYLSKSPQLLQLPRMDYSLFAVVLQGVKGGMVLSVLFSSPSACALIHVLLGMQECLHVAGTAKRVLLMPAWRLFAAAVPLLSPSFFTFFSKLIYLCFPNIAAPSCLLLSIGRCCVLEYSTSALWWNQTASLWEGGALFSCLGRTQDWCLNIRTVCSRPVHPLC